MPRYRNKSDEELWVPSLGRTVAPDEVIEVDKDKNVTWPESIWAEVADTSKKKSTTESGS